MRLRQGLAVLCCMGLISSTSHAAAVVDINTALAQIREDSTLVGGWMSDQLRYAAPFNSTTGNVVPKQLQFPGFEVGIEGMVSGTKLDVSGLHALPTSVVNPNSIDMVSRLPMPAALLHAKIALPFGLDAGIRLGGIPSRSFDKDSTHIAIKNNIQGIDLRKKVIEEGITRPFGLTMGLNFTRSSGHLDSSTPFSSQSQVSVNGTTYNSGLTANGSTTGSASSASHTTWDTKSWGLQAIFNKQILFLNPYVGASANRNFGSVGTSITTSGRETLTNPGNGADTAFEDFSEAGGGNANVNKWDLRALAGVEISFLPFLKLGINGEFAGNKNVGGDIGLRFQFH